MTTIIGVVSPPAEPRHARAAAGSPEMSLQTHLVGEHFFRGITRASLQTPVDVMSNDS